MTGKPTPDRLNVPCPYCGLECRVGMSHRCDEAPEGWLEVEVVRIDGKVVAWPHGKADE